MKKEEKVARIIAWAIGFVIGFLFTPIIVGLQVGKSFYESIELNDK